jgi:hypothetical protein
LVAGTCFNTVFKIVVATNGLCLWLCSPLSAENRGQYLVSVTEIMTDLCTSMDTSMDMLFNMLSISERLLYEASLLIKLTRNSKAMNRASAVRWIVKVYYSKITY